MARKLQLKGSVVAVSGGGRGIGLAIARACAAAGARVAIGDIDEALAVAAAQPLRGLGGRLDVRSRASFAAFLEQVERALGPVNVLVNNAGIMPIGAFEAEPDAMSDTQIDINLRGVIHGCKAALPGMIARGRGHVVNVASMAGAVPIPGLAVYCATKFAVVGLTQALREEYRDSGVGFSTIMPSKVTTELAAGSDGAARLLPTVSPEEVAAAVMQGIRQGGGEVAVPRYLGVAPALLDVTPGWLQRAFRRGFDDRRVLERMDHGQRAAYTRRIESLAARRDGA